MDEDYLKKFNYKNPPKFRLKRNKKVQEKYNKCLKDGTNKFFLDNLKQKLENENIIFLPNYFPYETINNIKHYCIWYKNPFDINDFIKQNNLNVVTYFENISKFKSIKDISHIHIFIK